MGFSLKLYLPSPVHFNQLPYLYLSYIFHFYTILLYKCFFKSVKNMEPSPYFIDEVTGRFRHEALCLRSPGSHSGGRTGPGLLRPIPELLPLHSLSCQDIQWSAGICFPLEKPVFSFWSQFWEKEAESGTVPLPQSFERPFVPSSMDIPQACSRQIHLPAGHNPCLHL